MDVADGAHGVAVFFERDVERAAAAIAALPFAEEVTARGTGGGGGHRSYLVRNGELYTIDVGEIEGLAVAVFEDDHDGTRDALGCWRRRGKTVGNRE